jgi:hypothetical protein
LALKVAVDRASLVELFGGSSVFKQELSRNPILKQISMNARTPKNQKRERENIKKLKLMPPLLQGWWRICLINLHRLEREMGKKEIE